MVVSFFQSILVIQPLKVQWREEFHTQKKACNLKLVILSSQVVFLAVFFALVIKKVDEEDYQHMVVVENNGHPGRRSWKCIFQGVTFGFLNWFTKTVHFSAGERKDAQTIRQGSRLYQPPAPADIERMKKNRILEQKAFAFLREFLSQ